MELFDNDKFVNKLILGDNLEVMKKMDKESVDLIYLDPPFLVIVIMKLFGVIMVRLGAFKIGGREVLSII